MPIKGFTDQGFVSFPKIGDIRKGAEKEPNKPGADLTYFRAVFPEDEGGAAATFARVYGDEPREVNVLLPFDEIERCWETWQEEHTAGALQHRCDGETCVMWRGEDGEMQFTPKPCPGGCVPQGRLKVIVPELRRLAYLVVHTTSVWDIHEITANLNALKGLTRNGIKGIPLVLKRRPRKISTPRGNGKRVRQEKWLLSVEADQQWVEQQLGAMARAALPATVESDADAEAVLLENRRLLRGDGEVDLVTGEVVGPDWDEVPDEDEEDPPDEYTIRLNEAMAYTLDSGRRLGQLTDIELNEVLDKITALDNPNQKMLTVKGHVEFLLGYLAKLQGESAGRAEPQGEPVLQEAML